MKTAARRTTPATIARNSLLDSFTLWNRIAQDHATMLLSAGEVVGRRTTRMAAHGLAPNAHERREMRRMVEEKQAALVEGSVAAWQAWVEAGRASWLEAWRLTMRNGAALAPMLTTFDARRSATRGRRIAKAAGTRTMASASRHWAASLDTQLRIADAALEPMRARVAANRTRLAR